MDEALMSVIHWSSILGISGLGELFVLACDL